MVVLVAWSTVIELRGLGSGRALIVAKLIVGARGTAATGVEFLGILMAVAWGKGSWMLVRAKVEVCQAFRVRELGAGMSGVRLVCALGRDQTYVSTGNPTHRKGNGRRGGGREGPVLGLGAGRNRVTFQENREDTSGAVRVGVEASGPAPKGQGETQRDLILEAVEALKALLGQGVGLRFSNQIGAHHREDDARRERSQGGNEGVEGVFVEEVDSGEEVGVQAEGGKKRKMGKGRFGGGWSSAN